jgi:two-component system, chemotaxis family, protein-glutamate methylesterase/glutaminase
MVPRLTVAAPDRTCNSMSNRRRDSLNVLVVDDSAVVREVMTAVLSQEPGMSVMVAANPFIATNKMRRQRPDVIVLDLEMPGMHGLTFLRKIMKEDPIPVVVCSAFTGQGTSIGLRALEEGAVDAVTKPRLGVREFLHESAVTLIDSVRAAAQANPTSERAVLPLPGPRLAADAILPTKLKSTSDKAQIVAIGASTGGTEALRLFLQAMPPDSPGLIIAQHMPEGFTSAFAKRLNEVCRIEVKEVANGDRIVTGQALIAPGNRHTAVRRIATQYIAEVIDGPLVCRHRPSVDVLFRSVAQAAGPNAIGVIMTGMGGDGAAGLLEMKQAGALTIAQDEASCVVFGMPKEAIDRGAVSRVVSLPRIPDVILSAAGRHHRLFAGVE